jgi:hypothetical protein
MRLLVSMLLVGLPSFRPEYQGIKQFGIKNEIAFFQIASELLRGCKRRIRIIWGIYDPKCLQVHPLKNMLWG